MESPCDAVILLLGIDPRGLKTGTRADTYTPALIAALFTMAEGWDQLVSIERGADKHSMICTYDGA